MQLRDLTEDDEAEPSEALLLRLEALEQEREVLRSEVERAKAVASSQSGRTRAVARQLAELQTQYAAVAGLRDEYELVQERLEVAEVQNEVQLSSARTALLSLRDEASDLEGQLADARQALEDPAMTEAGQRWMWLTAALLVMLSLLMVMLAL